MQRCPCNLLVFSSGTAIATPTYQDPDADIGTSLALQLDLLTLQPDTILQIRRRSCPDTGGDMVPVLPNDHAYTDRSHQRAQQYRPDAHQETLLAQ